MMAPYTTIVIAHFLNEIVDDITAKATAEIRRDLGAERDEWTRLMARVRSMISTPTHRFTKRDAPAMICPNCNSDNVTISYVQTKSDMKHKGSGLIGNSNNMLRRMTILCTLGLAWFFWPASKGTSKVKHRNQRHAVCQNCGKGWRIR